MLEHDLPVGQAKRPRRADIFEVPAAQELGAHRPDERGPFEQEHDAKQRPEAWRQNRGQDQKDIEARQRAKDFDEALQQKISPAAKKALHRAGRHAHGRREDRQDQAEQHGNAEAVDHARQHIAALVVGAEPIVPRRRRGRGNGQVELDRAVAVRDRRPDDPAAFFVDELLHGGIAVIGFSLKLAAELLLRVHLEDRHIERAVIFHEERLIVRDEFREQRDDEQHHENDEAVVAAFVRLEGPQAANVDRR